MSTDTQPLIAIGLFVVYTVLVAVLWRINHVRYDALVKSRGSILRGIVVPIGLGAALLIAATTVLGWWPAVLSETVRSGPGWALIVPALFAVAALISRTSIDFRSPQARLLPVLAVGTVLVGVAEELLCRGLLIVGPREGGWTEVAVFLVSTTLFALLHGINMFFGQPAGTTAVQIAVAFLAGTTLYITRMTTGSLLVCMVLHALWDFALLGTVATGGKSRPAAGLLANGTFLLGLVTVWFVLAD
ncbi:CPBP family intramembrane glutamic endopeptidase [Nakamurella sp. GG22]